MREREREAKATLNNQIKVGGGGPLPNAIGWIGMYGELDKGSTLPGLLPMLISFGGGRAI